MTWKAIASLSGTSHPEGLHWLFVRMCCYIDMADQRPSGLSLSTEFKAVMNLTQPCRSLCLLHWPGVSHPLGAGQKCSSSGPTPQPAAVPEFAFWPAFPEFEKHYTVR